MTLPAYSNSEEDQQVQAEIIRNTYNLLFSHPAMDSIIYWNLVDGYAASAEMGDMSKGENKFYGGLLNFDLTPKKSYTVLEDLIKNVWNTKTESVTDENGLCHFRGFYGLYSLEIMVGNKVFSKTIDLSKQR